MATKETTSVVVVDEDWIKAVAKIPINREIKGLAVIRTNCSANSCQRNRNPTVTMNMDKTKIPKSATIPEICNHTMGALMNVRRIFYKMLILLKVNISLMCHFY